MELVEIDRRDDMDEGDEVFGLDGGAVGARYADKRAFRSGPLASVGNTGRLILL